MAAPRSYSLAEIVERLGGEVQGDPQTRVVRVSTLDSAGPDDLAFLTRRRYQAQLGKTRAAAVILPRTEHAATGLPRILCDDPYLYYARVATLFSPAPALAPGIHSQAIVSSGAKVASTAHIGPACCIDEGAEIGEYVVLGAACVIGRDARIGDGSHLHASVVVYAGCKIGRRAIIHSGAVIGADGFGMAREGERWVKIPQTGRVVIGDDVEIGANTTIDRGALDDTVIEDGVKLDNQIQIGHNVRVGAHTAMAGCVGIAGSARIGRRCTLGGAAVVLGHIELGDDVHISAGTLVTKSIRKAGTYSGVFPLQEHQAWSRTAVLLRNIDRLETRLRALEHLAAPRPDKD